MQPRELVILAIVQAVLAGLASIGVLVFLALCKPLRKSKRLEDRIFKVLCLAVFAQGVLSVVSALERGLIFIPYQNFFGYALMFLPDLVFVLVVLIWLMFVDAAVNKSPDCIKRRFKYAHYPYIVMGGLLLLGYSLTWKVYDEMDTLGEASEFTMMFFRIWRESYYYIALAIIIVYLIAAFRTVQHKRAFAQAAFHRAPVRNKYRDADEQKHGEGGNQPPEHPEMCAGQHDRDNLQDDPGNAGNPEAGDKGFHHDHAGTDDITQDHDQGSS